MAPRSAPRGASVRAPWGEARALLALGLFLLLAAGGWLAGGVDDTPGWLADAQVKARSVRELGEGILDGLDPGADPRLLPAVLLLLLGCSPPLVAALMAIVGLALGAAAVFLLATAPRSGAAPSPAADSPRGGGPSWTAGLWLAASPIWGEAALACDPHLWAGLAWIVLAGRRGRAWLQVVLLGGALAYLPWAWVGLVPLCAGSLLGRGGPRWRGPALLLISLAALWVLNPLGLLDPSGWMGAMLRDARLDQVWAVQTHVGLRRTWLPLTGSVHVAGLALLFVAMPAWARRIRRGDFSPLAAAMVALLAARGGFATLAPVVMLLPWAAGEAGRGGARLMAALGEGRLRHAARLVFPLLLVPLIVVAIGRWQSPRGEGVSPDEAAARLEARLDPGTLVVHDPGFAPPDTSHLVWLALPFHAHHPALYAGAYWEGWMQAAGAFVVREQLLVRYLRDPERSAPLLRFYLEVIDEAEEEIVLGRVEGKRVRLLLRTPRPEALGARWRERLTRGFGRDLPGPFVASLGAALNAAGRSGDAVRLLEQALTAGYQDTGIYLGLASAHLELGRVMDAGRVLDEARRKDPSDPHVLFNLGLVLTQAEMWNRAVRTLAEVQRQWPRSAQVCYLLGVALVNDNRPAAGRMQLERALELDPDLPQRGAVEALLRRLEEGAP